MRIVLDTNLVVRAARPQPSVARSILIEAMGGPHKLILSNLLYLEIQKALCYDRVRQRHGLNDVEIFEFLTLLADGCARVILPPPAVPPLISADPEDDHVLQAAIEGFADVLGTNNRHFFTHDVTQLAGSHGIRIARDVELVELLRKPR